MLFRPGRFGKSSYTGTCDRDLLLLDLKALGERVVAKYHLHLLVGTGLGDLALAVVAAEADLDAPHFDGGLGIQLAAGERALHQFGLLGDHELMIGLGGKLGRVLLERLHATRAAKVNLGALVLDDRRFIHGLAGNRASGLHFGLLFGGNQPHGDDQNRNRRGKNVLQHSDTFSFFQDH